MKKPNSQLLSLRVPEPSGRPGDPTDFSHLKLDPAGAVEREMMILTVRAEPGTRGQVIELVDVFQGRIVDVGHEELTIELAGPPSKLDDFEDLMRAYGMSALQRTGRVALPKLERQATRLRSLGKVG